MRILLVNEKWGMSGGQERYILQVGNGLLRRGHDVSLIFGRLEGEVVDTSLAKFKTDLIDGLNLGAVSRYVQDWNPDVINLQNVYDAQLINSLNSKYPVTRFVHDHTTYCPGNSKYFFNSGKICSIATSTFCLINAYREKCMTRRPVLAVGRAVERRFWLEALRELPIVLCNSSYVRNQLILNGLAPEKVVVNGLFPGHNLLDWDAVSIGDPRRSNPQGKPPEILFVGRLFKEKGVDLLIKAVSRVPGPVRVQIVGDGWEKESLLGLAKDLKVEHKVNFLGFKSGQELANLYTHCDLFVMPSVWPEPFGMVGLEAGQFRKPVIAFNVGGVSDWLTDSVNGLLLPKPDVSLLAKAIEKLTDSPELCLQLGNNGFDTVNSQFSLERHLKVLEESYLKIMR